jgi:hypothetical protein
MVKSQRKRYTTIQIAFINGKEKEIIEYLKGNPKKVICNLIKEKINPSQVGTLNLMGQSYVVLKNE